MPAVPIHVLNAVDEQIALNAFYHASHRPLPVGDTITMRTTGGQALDVVDDQRPRGAAPRWHNFFMVDDAGVDCLETLGQSAGQHLYRVTPVTPVHETDYGWLEPIYDDPEYDAQTPEFMSRASALAERYWSGEPSSMPCRREYLTRSFRVEEDLGYTLPQGLKLATNHRFAPDKAQLAGVKADGLDFSNTTLTHADFRNASLRGAKFGSANLLGSDFRGADLHGAYLPNAVFRDADLKDADLSAAVLILTDFKDADLRGTKLTPAALTHSGVNFDGARRRDEDAPIPGWRRTWRGRLEAIP